jgi:hypothetical protein
LDKKGTVHPLPHAHTHYTHQHKRRKVLLPRLDLGARDEPQQQHDHVGQHVVAEVGQQDRQVDALARQRAADDDAVDLVCVVLCPVGVF